MKLFRAYVDLIQDLRDDLQSQILDIRTNGPYQVRWSRDKRTRFMSSPYLDVHNGSAIGYLISLTAAVHQQDPTISAVVFDRLERSAVSALRFGANGNGNGHTLAPLDFEALAADVHAVLEERNVVLDPETVLQCQKSSEACSNSLLEATAVVAAMGAITAPANDGYTPEVYYTLVGTMVARFTDEILGRVFLKKFRNLPRNQAEGKASLKYDKEWCAPYDSLTEEEKKSKKPCGDHEELKLGRNDVFEIGQEELHLHEILKEMTQSTLGGALRDIDTSLYELVQLLDMPFGDQIQVPYQAPFIQEQEGCSHRNYLFGPKCQTSSAEEQERMKISGKLIPSMLFHNI